MLAILGTTLVLGLDYKSNVGSVSGQFFGQFPNTNQPNVILPQAQTFFGSAAAQDLASDTLIHTQSQIGEHAAQNQGILTTSPVLSIVIQPRSLSITPQISNDLDTDVWFPKFETSWISQLIDRLRTSPPEVIPPVEPVDPNFAVWPQEITDFLTQCTFVCGTEASFLCGRNDSTCQPLFPLYQHCIDVVIDPQFPPYQNIFSELPVLSPNFIEHLVARGRIRPALFSTTATVKQIVDAVGRQFDDLNDQDRTINVSTSGSASATAVSGGSFPRPVPYALYNKPQTDGTSDLIENTVTSQRQLWGYGILQIPGNSLSTSQSGTTNVSAISPSTGSFATAGGIANGNASGILTPGQAQGNANGTSGVNTSSVNGGIANAESNTQTSIIGNNIFGATDSSSQSQSQSVGPSGFSTGNGVTVNGVQVATGSQPVLTGSSTSAAVGGGGIGSAGNSNVISNGSSSGLDLNGNIITTQNGSAAVGAGGGGVIGGTSSTSSFAQRALAGAQIGSDGLVHNGSSIIGVSTGGHIQAATSGSSNLISALLVDDKTVGTSGFVNQGSGIANTATSLTTQGPAVGIASNQNISAINQSGGLDSGAAQGAVNIAGQLTSFANGSGNTLANSSGNSQFNVLHGVAVQPGFTNETILGNSHTNNSSISQAGIGSLSNAGAAGNFQIGASGIERNLMDIPGVLLAIGTSTSGGSSASASNGAQSSGSNSTQTNGSAVLNVDGQDITGIFQGSSTGQGTSLSSSTGGNAVTVGNNAGVIEGGFQQSGTPGNNLGIDSGVNLGLGQVTQTSGSGTSQAATGGQVDNINQVQVSTAGLGDQSLTLGNNVNAGTSAGSTAVQGASTSNTALTGQQAVGGLITLPNGQIVANVQGTIGGSITGSSSSISPGGLANGSATGIINGGSLTNSVRNLVINLPPAALFDIVNGASVNDGSSFVGLTTNSGTGLAIAQVNGQALANGNSASTLNGNIIVTPLTTNSQATFLGDTISSSSAANGAQAIGTSSGSHSFSLNSRVLKDFQLTNIDTKEKSNSRNLWGEGIPNIPAGTNGIVSGSGLSGGGVWTQSGDVIVNPIIPGNVVATVDQIANANGIAGGSGTFAGNGSAQAAAGQGGQAGGNGFGNGASNVTIVATPQRVSAAGNTAGNAGATATASNGGVSNASGQSAGAVGVVVTGLPAPPMPMPMPMPGGGGVDRRLDEEFSETSEVRSLWGADQSSIILNGPGIGSIQPAIALGPNWSVNGSGSAVSSSHTTGSGQTSIQNNIRNSIFPDDQLIHPVIYPPVPEILNRSLMQERAFSFNPNGAAETNSGETTIFYPQPPFLSLFQNGPFANVQPLPTTISPSTSGEVNVIASSGNSGGSSSASASNSSEIAATIQQPTFLPSNLPLNQQVDPLFGQLIQPRAVPARSLAGVAGAQSGFLTLSSGATVGNAQSLAENFVDSGAASQFGVNQLGNIAQGSSTAGSDTNTQLLIGTFDNPNNIASGASLTTTSGSGALFNYQPGTITNTGVGQSSGGSGTSVVLDGIAQVSGGTGVTHGTAGSIQ